MVAFGAIATDRRAENRSMSAVPRKRLKVRALASVAKGHGGARRERLIFGAGYAPTPNFSIAIPDRLQLVYSSGLGCVIGG